MTSEADVRKFMFAADQQEGETLIDRSCAMVLGLFKVWKAWLQQLRSLYGSSLWLRTATLGPQNASLVATMA